MPKAQNSANTIADNKTTSLARLVLSNPFTCASQTQRKGQRPEPAGNAVEFVPGSAGWLRFAVPSRWVTSSLLAAELIAS